MRAGSNEFTDHGYFEIAAGVTNTRIEEVIKEILKECTRLRTELVSPAELAKAKEYIIGNMKLELEASDEWANFYGGQEIFRRKIETPEMIEAKIRKVTAKNIQELANTIFTDKNLNLAVIGPFEDKNQFFPILSFKQK